MVRLGIIGWATVGLEWVLARLRQFSLTEFNVNRPSRWLMAAAFAAIYLIWGSSYISIHFAIQTIPPLLMTASRFLSSGLLLIGWALLRGTPRPTLREWRSAVIIGGFLFLLNNGSIVWAEGHGVPTGIVAVVVATVPMWMVLLTWLRRGGKYPGSVVIGGLALGFVGIILLISPDKADVNPVGVLAVTVGAFCWAFGSLYAKSASLPQSAALSTGMELFCGGVMQLACSLLSGELGQFNPAQVSASSLLATAYLAMVSSIIAYSAFAWLMRVSTPARVSTYAYVNPVVAVLLGWLLASEPLNPRTLVAAAIIIVSVILINGYKVKSLPRLPAAEVVETA